MLGDSAGAWATGAGVEAGNDCTGDAAGPAGIPTPGTCCVTSLIIGGTTFCADCCVGCGKGVGGLFGSNGISTGFLAGSGLRPFAIFQFLNFSVQGLN